MRGNFSKNKKIYTTYILTVCCAVLSVLFNIGCTTSMFCMKNTEVETASEDIPLDGGTDYPLETIVTQSTASVLEASPATTKLKESASTVVDAALFTKDKLKSLMLPAKGIDVSDNQGDIDWETVKNEIDFAVLRCGCGYNSPSQDDLKFKYNADECTRLGIPFGVYLYSYADNVAEAVDEAEHVLRMIDGYDLSLPVFLDIEDEESYLDVSAHERGEMAKAFCDVISNKGYNVGIYANLVWWQNHLTDPIFNNPDWAKWVAQYYPYCTYKSEYSCWQYSDQGRVAGIDAFVDLNYWNDSRLRFFQEIQQENFK